MWDLFMNQYSLLTQHWIVCNAPGSAEERHLNGHSHQNLNNVQVKEEMGEDSFSADGELKESYVQNYYLLRTCCATCHFVFITCDI